jgi:CBS-domain-containing membrane protein
VIADYGEPLDIDPEDLEALFDTLVDRAQSMDRR